MFDRKEYLKKWKEAHKEQQREYYWEYYRAHKEQFKQRYKYERKIINCIICGVAIANGKYCDTCALDKTKVSRQVISLRKKKMKKMEAQKNG